MEESLRREQRQQLNTLLMKLPARERCLAELLCEGESDAMVYAEVLGLSPDEVSQELLQTVGRWKERVRKRLRRLAGRTN